MRRERPALFKERHFEAEIIVLCVRRYLRYALSLRNLEEIMVERNVHVDHVTIWRWIQCYAPELNRRCQRELRRMNAFWRVDETYLRVAGKWTYLYRAVDSTGDTIDFLLSPKRDADAAKRFFQKALRSPNHPCPRVINVDGNPTCPKVIEDLKRMGRRCRCRPIRYLNNIVEQDHRAIKRRVRASQGFRSFPSAWRTIQGIETRTDPVVAEKRSLWARHVYFGSLRSRDDCLIRGDPAASRFRFQFCNTSKLFNGWVYTDANGIASFHIGEVIPPSAYLSIFGLTDQCCPSRYVADKVLRYGAAALVKNACPHRPLKKLLIRPEPGEIVMFSGEYSGMERFLYFSWPS